MHIKVRQRIKRESPVGVSTPAATWRRKWMLGWEVTKRVVLPRGVTITHHWDSYCSITWVAWAILPWESRQARRVRVFHTSWLLLHVFYLAHDQFSSVWYVCVVFLTSFFVAGTNSILVMFCLAVILFEQRLSGNPSKQLLCSKTVC